MGLVERATRSFSGGLATASTYGRPGGEGAPGSPPAAIVVSSQRAVSSTVCVTQPVTDIPLQWSAGVNGMRPRWGFRPKRLQKAAGLRIDPAPSDADPAAARPATK